MTRPGGRVCRTPADAFAAGCELAATWPEPTAAVADRLAAILLAHLDKLADPGQH